VDGDEQQTGEMRQSQADRAETEEQRADTSELPDEQRQHERRADKAGYLAEKLAERERSEREAAEDG
jgi:hypothetical protein